MFTLTYVVLWLFAFLFALALAVVVTPVKLSLRFRSSPQWRLRIEARLFGGTTPAIPFHDSARRSTKKRAKRRPRRTHRKDARSRKTSGLRMFQAAPKLFADLLRPIRLTRLEIDADVGLGDPADTGQLFGLLAPIVYARPMAAISLINIRPDFTASRASGTLMAELSFIPAALIPPGVRFAWHAFGPRQ